jgi:hypothetical protein
MPASYAMGTMFLSRGKEAGYDFDHSPPSRAEVKERVGIYRNAPLYLHDLI